MGNISGNGRPDIQLGRYYRKKAESPQWIWDACYSAIATANQALEAIENMGSPAELNPQRRSVDVQSIWTFYSVNLFAKSYGASSANDLGLVYMTAPETQVKPEYKRESVKAVYDKINADIEEALPLIDDALYQVPQYHFNKRASLAFATRFNLYYRKYDKTIECYAIIRIRCKNFFCVTGKH